MKIRSTSAALLAGAALAAAPAAAQTAPADTLPSFRLEGLTVTALRAPVRADQLPQRVDVVSRAEIERTGARDVAELLKKTAGVDVLQYPGLLSGVGLRGFRPQAGGTGHRTLLLVDGRPAGAENLATVDLHTIERVEVVRGPVSALYGSSAMGGVVNLVTRRSTGALEGDVSARLGSFRTTELAARAGGALSARVDGDVSATYFRQGEAFRIGEGNVLRDLVGSDSATKLFADGRTQRVAETGDGARRPFTEYGYGSGRARLGLRLSDAWRADASGEWFRADDVQTPGDIFAGSDYALYKDLDRRDGELRLSAPEHALAPVVRVFTARSVSDYTTGVEEGRYVNYTGEVRTFGAQLQGTLRRGAHSLVSGLDYTTTVDESRVFSGEGVRAAPYSPDAATRSAAAFAEARFAWLGGRLTGNAGGRLDRVWLELRETPFRTDVEAGSEDFLVFNPSAGLQYALGGGVRVHGTAGRAFVAPGAFNQAGRVVSRSASTGVAGITVGNPGISEESSVTVDVGVGISRPRLGLDADVTYFRTRVEDRITSARASFPAAGRPLLADGTPVSSVTTYVNAARARMDGVEWRAGLDLAALAGRDYSLRLFANGTHLLTSAETTRTASVDAARFAGRTDFRPEEVFGAFVFGDATTADVRNVADLTLNYGVEWDDRRRFSARLSGRYVGERTDVDFTDFSNVSDIRYPAFMVLDAFAGVRLSERLRLSVIANNLSDENYYEKRGYNLPGRSLSVGVTVGL